MQKHIQNKYILLQLLLVVSFFLTNVENIQASGAVENLDEVVARKPRLSTAAWGYQYLQDDANNYTWQPETLNYYDTATDNEVWRFTHAPVINNTQDIAVTHWSANGKRLLFHSKRPTNAFNYADGTRVIWMLSNTDGSRLKPAKNAPAHLTTVDKYPLWSTILEDTFYQGMSNDGQSTAINVLYKAIASDTTVSRTPWLTITPSNSGFMSLKKAISGDGRKITIQADNKFYPVTVYPESSKGFDSPPGGYSNALNFDTYWGGIAGWGGYHDRYATGAINGVDGVWNILMPETPTAIGPFWRARLTGSGTNGSPVHTQDQTIPFDFGGEVEPVNTVGDNFPHPPSPWCQDGSENTNLSVTCVDTPDHGSPDRWGHYMIGENSHGVGNRYGIAFLNMRSHVVTGIYDRNFVNANHPDWEAWSDWSIESTSPAFSDPASGPTAIQSIVMQKYTDLTYQKNLVYTHPRYNLTGSYPYEANARPFQSPDGTKVMFNTTFLSDTDTKPQLFWTVAYYPYPPEIKSASKNETNVKLDWDFNQGQNCSNSADVTNNNKESIFPNLINPRTYATRGWPHETLDCPPSPREIKNFRIWISDDNSTWTPAGTVSYNNCSGNNECGMWTESSWSFDHQQPNDTTKYYAITSVEYSGLESRTLSNVWKVTLDNSGNIIEQGEQETYPADPGGKSNFYQTSPTTPKNITSQHKLAPANADGQYTLTWSAPTNKTMVRYYNIYAHDGSAPQAVQQMRIASIAATSDYDSDNNFKYIDWLGNPDGSTQYKITSVDYQGNESGLTSTDTVAPAVPSGLVVQ